MMTYYADIMTPEVYNAWTTVHPNLKPGDVTVTGVRCNREATARSLRVGDRLISYVTEDMYWVGAFEIILPTASQHIAKNGVYFVETSSRWGPCPPDEFHIRFEVKVLAWSKYYNKMLRIHHPDVFGTLSFTKNGGRWSWMVQQTLMKMKDKDGRFLEKRIKRYGK